jgi:hypothetical protein
MVEAAGAMWRWCSADGGSENAVVPAWDPIDEWQSCNISPQVIWKTFASFNIQFKLKNLLSPTHIILVKSNNYTAIYCHKVHWSMNTIEQRTTNPTDGDDKM